MKLKRILVTGGCGFIGANFVRLELERPVSNHEPRRPDLRRQPRQPRRPGDRPALPVRAGRHRRPARSSSSCWPRGFDALVHFAAESHVDRSIDDATPFLRTNVVGTQILLDAAPRGEVAAVRPGLHRRGLRHARPRRPGVHRGDPAGAQQPLLRQQGRRPTCWSAPRSTPTACTSSSPAARTTTGRTSSPRS